MTEKLFLIALLKILSTPNVENIECLNKFQIKEKNYYNTITNRLCKKYLSRLDVSENEKVKVLFIIGFLIRFIYKFRLNKIKKLKIFLNNKLFLKITYIFLKIHFFIKLVQSIKILGYKYNYDLVPKKNFILAADFPSHAFAINSQNDELTCSSFAEFIAKWHGNNVCLISLDEYVRFSKAREPKDGKEKIKLRNLKRIKLLKKFSSIQFIKNLIIFILNNPSWNFNSIFNLLRAGNLIESLRYRKIIAQSNCKAFYTLPFSKFNYFDNNFLGPVKTFQYSENFIVPPYGYTCMQSSLNLNYVMSLINPGALSSRYPQVGFNSLSSKVYSKLLIEIVGHAPHEITVNSELPVALGYESNFKTKEKGLFVAIFDNPSESIKTQFSRSISGDLTANEDFIKDFLNETFETASKCGFRILFKSKYSLSSSAFNDYSKILMVLLKKYKENLILVDPYARLSDVINVSNIVISLPFTSTKTFADTMGIQSYYYVPSSYLKFFDENLNILSKEVISLEYLKETMINIKNLSGKG